MFNACPHGVRLALAADLGVARFGGILSKPGGGSYTEDDVKPQEWEFDRGERASRTRMRVAGLASGRHPERSRNHRRARGTEDRVAASQLPLLAGGGTLGWEAEGSWEG